MIAKLRSVARSIGSKILMGLLVLTFGVWGVGDMLSSSSSNVNVASVGDVNISLQDYQRGVYRENEKLRNMLGKQFTPEIAKSFGIEQRVLQQLIDKQLLSLEAKSIGLRISDADVVRSIRVSPAFQDDKGNFSKQQFESMLRVTGQSEKDFVQKMREDMAMNLLVSTITETITPPDNAAATLLSARNEQRNIELYTLSPSLVKSLPAPNDEQLKEYYNAHAADFTTPEYRKISYVVITGADSKKTQLPSDKEVETSYQERRDEFKKPERRKVEQLLFGSEESAKKEYSAIIGGKSFEQVGKGANILNPATISLGLVEKANLPADAADKVFDLKKDEVTAPIKSAFGWHIFRVSDIIPAAVAPLSEVRAQIIKDLEQSNGENATVKLSNELDDAVASGSTLAEAAKELGLKIITLPPIDKNGRLENGEAEKALPNQDKFLETAFKTEEKTESQLLAGKAGVSYILRVENIIPEHLRPFEDVKQKLIAGWTEQEKSKALADVAKKIATEFASRAGREKAIKAYGIAAPSLFTLSRTKENAAKIPAQMLMDIFAKPTGGASEEFLLPDGSYAVAVIGNIIPAKFDQKSPKTAAELAAIKKQYGSTLQNEITAEYLHYLAKKYKISVNIAAMQVKSQE